MLTQEAVEAGLALQAVLDCRANVIKGSIAALLSRIHSGNTLQVDRLFAEYAITMKKIGNFLSDQ
jgi:hypothetical protein